MSTLRIGLIGFGMRAVLARELERPGNDAVVTVVCDPSERGRADAAREYPDALITADLAEALASDVDAVMVLTPDDQHVEPILAALEAGKAVFSEMPLAITVADTDRILVTARRTGSRLYVGHNMRHMPVITVMKALIDEGRIGRVKAVWCRHFVGNGGDFYFTDWHADRSKVTGLLLQKGAHDIDVIHWLAGGYTRSVAAMGDNVVYGAIDDRRDRAGERMWDWFSLDNWPPTAQRGLHPVIGVEDISQVNMRLDNGVLASYEQCHFTLGLLAQLHRDRHGRAHRELRRRRRAPGRAVEPSSPRLGRPRRDVRGARGRRRPRRRRPVVDRGIRALRPRGRPDRHVPGRGPRGRGHRRPGHRLAARRRLGAARAAVARRSGLLFRGRPGVTRAA